MGTTSETGAGSIITLAYLGIDVPSLEGWEEFATDVIGAGFAPRGADGSLRLRLDDRHHRVALRPAGDLGLAYVGWETRNHENYLVRLEHLRRLGIEVHQGTQEECDDRYVEAMSWMLDPAGLRHEVFVGQGSRHHSFLPSRAHQGFVTGELGMGHVVVFTRQFDEVDAFVREALGLTVSRVGSTPVGKGGFYRCNPRQHTLAVLDDGEHEGLAHFMVEAKDLDDVGVSYDAALAREAGVGITLGKHAVDMILSFYALSPSGFWVEIGHGGLKFEKDSDDVAWRGIGSREVWGHRRLTMLPPSLTTPRKADVSS